MKKTLSLLIATTALTAVIGIPAWGMLGTGSGAQPAMLQSGEASAPLVLVDDDGEEDDDDGNRTLRRAGGGEEDEGEDDDDDDDDDCEGGQAGCGGAKNPAPAGSVAPPSNGLFGTGAPPKVQVN